MTPDQLFTLARLVVCSGVIVLGCAVVAAAILMVREDQYEVD